MEFLNTEFWILVSAAFVTSTISGVMGMGGGILLLAVMSQILPPIQLIPIHGLVQLASNTSRAGLNYSDLNKKILISFAGGAVIGAAVGSQFVVTVSMVYYKLLLGGFILFATWAPKPKKALGLVNPFPYVGGVAAFCSLFIGATGPLIAPFFLRKDLNKRNVVATKAACQTVVHTLKIIVFSWVGFEVGRYLPAVIAMIVMVFIGTWCGKQLLGKLPEELFKWAFKILITVLALRMILSSFA